MTEIDIGGTGIGQQHDQLYVEGTVELDGTLVVSQLDEGKGSYQPNMGDRFTVVAGTGGISGTFDSVVVNGLDPSLAYQTQYNEFDVTLLVAALLAGDANSDGVVSGGDLIAVQQNFGKTGPADGFLLGDANDDGAVSGSDLIIVQQRFGNALGPVQAPIPEPGTLLLVATVFLLRQN